jgi:drug/metabolite transporter (DMT)-like permease
VIARDDLHRDLVIVACAISTGIHAALVPEHLEENAGAGAGFAISAAALAALAVALTRRRGRTPLAAAAVVLAGLLVAYGFAVTTGVPLLHPDPEPVEGLALFTKAVEFAGLASAARLLRRGVPLIHPRSRGMLA